MEIRIRDAVAATLPELPEGLRKWSESHLTTPRLVTVATDPDGTQYREFWLVTDDNGVEDSSYRIVFDDSADAFGLECTLDTGVSWYMGSYGSSFAATVEAM